MSDVVMLQLLHIIFKVKYQSYANFSSTRSKYEILLQRASDIHNTLKVLDFSPFQLKKKSDKDRTIFSFTIISFYRHQPATLSTIREKLKLLGQYLTHSRQFETCISDTPNHLT